ncbi:hypothetical protein ACA910_017366 [Epithemia clementina (nom. ined.)]
MAGRSWFEQQQQSYHDTPTKSMQLQEFLTIRLCRRKRTMDDDGDDEDKEPIDPQQSRLARWQRCRRRQSRGTMLSFRKPTRRRVSQWFGSCSKNPVEFNHDFVGMTHPLGASAATIRQQLQDEPSILYNTQGDDYDDDSGLTTTSTTKNNGYVVAKPPRDQQRTSESCWWPRQPGPSLSSWRVLCYRRRLGYGLDCYERVRQAVLDMEFASKHGSKGIVAIVVKEEENEMDNSMVVHQRGRGRESQKGGDGNDGTQQRKKPRRLDPECYNPKTASRRHRRFVTYTRYGPFPGICIYAVNPVATVYHVEDKDSQFLHRRSSDDRKSDKNFPNSKKNNHHDGQREVLHFSSIAFATLKGHWLCGEERVTVILRNNRINKSKFTTGADSPAAAVDVEILSLSKASDTVWVKLVWPFIGRLQNSFFVQQLQALERSTAQQVC